jgi:hypothetical protein
VRVPAGVEEERALSGENGLEGTPAQAATQGAAEELLGQPTGQLGTPALGYVVVPLQEGRPALDVEDEVGTLSAYSPRSGRGLQYEYDLSGPALEIGPAVTTSLGLRGPELQMVGAGIAAETGRYRAALYGTRAGGRWGVGVRLTAQHLFTALN